MMLKSFGCSFTFGSDLFDCDYPEYSLSTWPAFLAKSLDYEYECYAQPGIGNLQIYHTVLSQLPLTNSDIFVINWTWLDRFDFMDPIDETWHTIRPDGTTKEHQLYYRHFYNQYHTMMTNAAYISSAISLLNKYNKKFIMTIMDENLFSIVNPNWQDPRSITLLQNEINPYITTFEGQSFLEWSKKKGFAISETLHPLEQAHQSAFELIKSYNLL